MPGRLVIYIAAPMFNISHNFFNARLAEELEKKNYKVILPSRDGFNFRDIRYALKSKIPEEKLETTVQDLIYCLDIGRFVPDSDVVLANLDEPGDQGVDVECVYARMMGKYVIGFRTDSRTPYGGADDLLGGAHFFPVYQCDKLVISRPACRFVKEGEAWLKRFVDELDIHIHQSNVIAGGNYNSTVVSHSPLADVFKYAERLFSGLPDLHSLESLNKIVDRHVEYKRGLPKIAPSISHI